MQNETMNEVKPLKDLRERSLRGIAHSLCAAWAAQFKNSGHDYFVSDPTSILFTGLTEPVAKVDAIPPISRWRDIPEKEFWSKYSAIMEKCAISFEDVEQEILKNPGRYWRTSFTWRQLNPREQIVARLAKELITLWTLFYRRKGHRSRTLPHTEKWTDIPLPEFWQSRRPQMDELEIHLEEIEQEIRNNPDRYPQAHGHSAKKLD